MHLVRHHDAVEDGLVQGAHQRLQGCDCSGSRSPTIDASCSARGRERDLRRADLAPRGRHALHPTARPAEEAGDLRVLDDVHAELGSLVAYAHATLSCRAVPPRRWSVAPRTGYRNDGETLISGQNAATPSGVSHSASTPFSGYGTRRIDDRTSPGSCARFRTPRRELDVDAELLLETFPELQGARRSPRTRPRGSSSG